MTSVAGFDGHQGVALIVAPRRWATLEDIIARAATEGQPPLVLVLDSLEDPQNVGTLLRTAEACGVHGVLFPTRRAAPLTPAAVKASAGASEHLLLAPVDDLPGSLVDLRGRGLRLVAADEQASLAHREADLRGPLALVIGSEGRGVSGQIRRRIDLSVRIPMVGRIASLNAAVAGSVLLFEAAGQRGVGTDATDRTAPPIGPQSDAAERGSSVDAADANRPAADPDGARQVSAELAARDDAEPVPPEREPDSVAPDHVPEPGSAPPDAATADPAADDESTDTLLPGERRPEPEGEDQA